MRWGKGRGESQTVTVPPLQGTASRRPRTGLGVLSRATGQGAVILKGGTGVAARALAQSGAEGTSSCGRGALRHWPGGPPPNDGPTAGAPGEDVSKGHSSETSHPRGGAGQENPRGQGPQRETTTVSREQPGRRGTRITKKKKGLFFQKKSMGGETWGIIRKSRNPPESIRLLWSSFISSQDIAIEHL